MLAGELKPVRPVKWSDGAILTLVALLVTIGAGAAALGFRDGLWEGRVSALFVIASGLNLLVGLASASAVISMASPQVGSRNEGPKWAIATLALLPLAAIITTAAEGIETAPLYRGYLDWHCVIFGGAFSLLVAPTLILWLRRGAPVSLGLAGLYAGTASGALGVFAYGLDCPVEGIAHFGIWHVIPVCILALVGRFFVPRMVRW